MRKRALRVLSGIAVFVALGLIYGMFYMATGIGVPCVFNKITGLRCPGCGVTHMCVALMRGNIFEAIHYNSLLFFLSPLLLLILVDYIIRYIKTGRWTVLRWQTIILCVMIVLFVLFGIGRNLI